MISKKIILILISLVILSTLFEFKFGNYSLTPIQGNWDNNDQMLQIPSIYRLSNEKLFANDPIIGEYINIYPTLLFSLMANVYNISSNMMFSYFIVFLILKTVFIISVFLLSNLLLKSRNAAIIATLFLSFTHFMGADEIGLTEVVPKNFAFAFMPLIFYLFLKDREKYKTPCFLMLGILSLFHIFSTMPVVIMFCYSYISKNQYRKIIWPLAIFLLLAVPYMLLTQNSTGGSIDSSIASIVPYANPLNGFVTIAKYLPIIIGGIAIVFLERKSKKPRFDSMEFIRWFVIITVYSLVSAAGLFSIKLSLLTFYRAFKYAIFFSLIFISPFIYSCISSGKNKKRIIGAIALFTVMFYFSSLFYSSFAGGFVKSQSQYSSEIGNVIKISKWIDNNIEKNETIMSPPDWGVIRIWSKRQTVITDADIYILKFSQDKFPDRKFYDDVIDAYAQNDANAIINLAKQKNIKYAVTYGLDIEADVVFAEGKFNIYKI